MSEKRKQLLIPDILLLEVRDMIIFDNYTGELTLIVFANPEEKFCISTSREEVGPYGSIVI